jgi:hypothetical protein
MTEHKSPDRENWEEKINALLEGELDQDESEDLKRAATSDQYLARAIVEAYQLQRAMEHVQVEKAPSSLQRKLKQIPRQNRPVYLQPRWVAAFAAVPLMVISAALMRSPGEPGFAAPPAGNEQAGIDQVKLDRARQDLAIAFAYIDQVSDRTSNRIESEIGGGMSQAVAGSIFKTIQHQKIL